MRVIDCATASEIGSSSAAATLPPFNSSDFETKRVVRCGGITSPATSHIESA